MEDKAIAVQIESLGKMYRLFDSPKDRMRNIFGTDKLRFWDKRQTYREFWALRDVNLTVPKGSRLGIIGRNGAGKSTLLKLVTGNIQPTEGSIQVAGRIQALMQIGTGFHPEFTGLENIRTALAYEGLDGKKARSLTEDIVDFSELADYIYQPVKYYSAGMYARLAFAVATSVTPDILIIDEVLGAGDAAFASKCAIRMKTLTQETGATVLFVSHSMDSVLEICENAILLERGVITHAGSALEVSKIYNQKIREEDELRNRVKEIRSKNKQFIAEIGGSGMIEKLLFRFVCDRSHPAYQHAVRICEIRKSDKLLSTLYIGAPMDDDPSQESFVISDLGAMDWGKPQKGRDSYFRYYCNMQGANCHASFQMGIPPTELDGQMSLTVQASPDNREPVYVEYYDGRAYKRLGQLQEGVSEFMLPPVARSNTYENSDTTDAVDTLEPANEASETSGQMESLRQSNSVYGLGAIDVISIDLLDEDGISKRVYETGETLRFVIAFQSKKPILHCTFVINILTTSGRVATQVLCDSEDLGLREIDGEYTIEAKLSPLRLGAEEYMASIGFFKECNLHDEKENQAYCVVDRAVFFKVLQPAGIKKSMGGFLHVCTWRENTHTFDFDATSVI